jgi:hypothetical protein
MHRHPDQRFDGLFTPYFITANHCFEDTSDRPMAWHRRRRGELDQHVLVLPGGGGRRHHAELRSVCRRRHALARSLDFDWLLVRLNATLDGATFAAERRRRYLPARRPTRSITPAATSRSSAPV